MQLDARNIVTHQRIPDQQHQRITLVAHRPAAKGSSAAIRTRKNKPSSKRRQRSPTTSQL
jgi:hypothetical protein